MNWPEEFLVSRFDELRSQLDELRRSADYRALRAALEATVTPRLSTWLESATSRGSDDAGRLWYLLAGVSSVEVEIEELASTLDEARGDQRAAAFCLVERFHRDEELFRRLLISHSPFEAALLQADGRYHIIDLIGLAGRTGLSQLLDEVLLHQYHYDPPMHTALALERLGVEVDSNARGLRRSISVYQSGSTLLIDHDERFTGSSNCTSCRKFFPCRVNRYYRGAIEDCKLWNQTDPESLFELRDLRPQAEGGPTAERSQGNRRGLATLRLEADSHEASGRFEEAAEALRLAAREEPVPDSQLRLLTRAVRLLSRVGNRSAAYGLLTLAEDKARQTLDESTLRAWDRTRLSLIEELGIYVSTGSAGSRTPEGRNQADLLARLRRGPGSNPKELGAALSMIEEYLRRGNKDPWLCYRWLSYLVSYCHFLGEPERGQKTLEWLFLEASNDPTSALERDVIEARQAGYRGDSAGAAERFEHLLPQIRGVPDEDRRFEYMGYVIEAFGRESAPDFSAIVAHAGEARRLYRSVLAGLASAPARRRLRQRHQRTVECIVRALVYAADLAQPGPLVQIALRESWQVILATRNPELQAPRLAMDKAQARKLRHLEDSLHRGLHYHIVEGKNRGEFLEDFLQKVLDLEVAHVARKQENQLAEARYETDPAILWFELRDLEPGGHFLVLTRLGDTVSRRWIDEPRSSSWEPLWNWCAYLKQQAQWGNHALRARREVAGPALSDARIPEPDRRWVQEATERLLVTDGLLGGEDQTSCSLYPEGSLYTLPLETLPDPTRPGSCLGERLATRYRLSSKTFSDVDPRVDLSAGWLGFGAAPQAPLQPQEEQDYFPELPGTKREVEAIAGALRALDIDPVTVLTGSYAHLGNLTNALELERPAVLHLAVHGVGDQDYPDACALILASEPGGAAGELLPFRLMRDLPLESVELVVLSACSSLVGPVGAGTGVEGLAWALLEAGVDQVIATRYTVDDRHAADFMRILYHHLLGHGPAEALRRARVEAIRQAGIPLHEVGAWALLC